MIKRFVNSGLVLISILLFSSGCTFLTPKISKTPILSKSINSLNIQAIQKAQVAQKGATKVEANYYAPITFSLANKELKTAMAIIETDYSQTKKINTYALLAQNNYEKATRITQLAKVFEKNDFSNEDYILWYQNQLKKINAPTKMKIDFTQDNKKVVEDVRENIATLARSLEESRADYSKLSSKYANLKKSNIKTSLYDYAMSQLNNDEATVTKKDDGVFLFVTGFRFPKKGAKLGSNDSKLISKILNIINYIPNMKIKIVGYTDSIGTIMQNQKLSQTRVKNILKALVDAGFNGISRVTTKAFGESKPVVSNMLKAGRAKNRRIEIYIHK